MTFPHRNLENKQDKSLYYEISIKWAMLTTVRRLRVFHPLLESLLRTRTQKTRKV